jgi:hypothetical protein
MAIGAGLLSAMACSGGGVSQGDYDKVKNDLQDQQTQNQQLQQQLANAPKAAASGVAAASGTNAASDTIWLLGAKKVPKAPPAPSPTPTPAGYVAPPKPTPAASFYEQQPYFVYVEVLQASRASTFDVQSTLSCVPASQFVRGQRIVWRYDIIDGKTGKRITDKDGAKVKIVLPNNVDVSASFSQRAGGRIPDAPFMWSSNWDIPLDYPLGGIDYKVVITSADGNSFTWAPPSLVSADGASDTRPKVYQ